MRFLISVVMILAAVACTSVTEAQVVKLTPYLFDANGQPIQPDFAMVIPSTSSQPSISSQVRPYNSNNQPRTLNGYVLLNPDGTDYASNFAPAGAGGVSSFNTRTGAVTLTNADINTAITSIPSATTATTQAVSDSSTKIATTQFVQTALANAPPPRGFIDGCAMSVAGGTAAFNISACQATSSDATTVMVRAAVAKTLASNWTVGASGGCLDTGSTTNTTWYHIFEIERPDTGVVDYACSITIAGPTVGGSIPSAYTKSRYIGSMLTDSSTFWTTFAQYGDTFMWVTPVNNVSATTGGAALTNFLATVPPGVRVEGIFSLAGLNGSSGWYAGIYSPDQSGVTLGATTAFLSNAAGSSIVNSAQVRAWTNTSKQALYAATTGTQLTVTTFGYVNPRGKNN